MELGQQEPKAKRALAEIGNTKSTFELLAKLLAKFVDKIWTLRTTFKVTRTPNSSIFFMSTRLLILLIVTSVQQRVSCAKIKCYILGIKRVRILFVFFADAWPASPYL